MEYYRRLFLDKQRLQSYQTPPLNKESDEDDDRINDDSSCTVSTQSTVGPTGELVIGDFSHVLYSTFSKAIMRDIEGTELQILSCKSDNDCFEQESRNICSFDNLLNLRDLINMKKLKNQISLLKKNIYSSIFEIREKSSTVGVVTEQREEGHQIKEDSSDIVTIPTPYTGVVIRAKKKPNESNTHNQFPQYPPTDIRTVGEALSGQLTIKASGLNTVSNVSKIDKDSIKEKNDVKIGIEVTKSKSSNKNEIQKRRTLEEHSINFLDPPIRKTCNLNPNESFDRVSPLPIGSLDKVYETVEKSFITEKHTDSFKKIAENTKNLKQSNVILHHFASDSGDLKNILDKTPEISHTKQNIFVKNGIPIDQLRNTNTKKFVKCLSYDNGVHNRNKGKQNKKGVEAKGNKSFQSMNEMKNGKICWQNTNETTSHLRNLSTEETKIKAQILDSKLLPSCTMKQNEHVKLDQNVNTLIADNLPYDLSLNLPKEKDFPQFLNNSIPLSFLQQTPSHNPSKKLKGPILTNLELKIDSNSKYNEISKYKESFQQPDIKASSKQQNIKERLPQDSIKEIDVSLTLDNAIKKTRLLNKKVSNLSSMVRRILCKKMHKPVQSLPEPNVYRSFRRSYPTKKDMGETETKTYVKNSKNKGEDPKISEREVFSVKYSAISEMKCCSKFLNIQQAQSYPMEQKTHDIQRLSA